MIRRLSIFALLSASLFCPSLASAESVSNRIAAVISSVDGHIQAALVACQLTKGTIDDAYDNLMDFADQNYALCNSSSNFQYAVTNLAASKITIQTAIDNLTRAHAALGSIDLSGLHDSQVTNITIVVTNVNLTVVTNACESCNRKLDAILSLLQSELDGTTLSTLTTRVEGLYSSLDAVLSSLEYYYLMLSNQLLDVLDQQTSHYNSLYTAVTNSVGDGVSDPGAGPGSGSGSGSGCGCADYLSAILYVLGQIRDSLDSCLDILEAWHSPLSSYLDFYNSLQEIIAEYYNLLVERYREVDASLPQNLATMWENTYSQIDDIVNKHRLSSSEDDISSAVGGLLSGDVRLSNEGYILGYQLAFQERQYLTQLATYAWLTNQTFATSNFIDLAWLEDYLLQVQKPYYQMWNDEYLSRPPTYYSGPFSVQPLVANMSPFQSVTNLWNGVSPSSDVLFRSSAYRSWRIRQTNYWDRIETLLLGLNGFFYFEKKEDTLTSDDKLEFDDLLSSSTNEVDQLVGRFDSWSNGVHGVFGAFTNCLHAFEIEINSGEDRFRLFPGGGYFGIDFPPIELPYSTLDDITTPIRRICSFIWYVGSAFGSFFFFVYFVGLVIKVVVRIVAMIRQFMAP